MVSGSFHQRHGGRWVAPEPVEIIRGSWIWAARVPYIPDVGRDLDQVESPVNLLGYHALAEAISSSAPGGSAVQLRLLVADAPPDGTGIVVPYFLGRARSVGDSKRLAQLMRSTLPSEVVLETITTAADLAAVLGHVDVASNSPSMTAEVCRRVEELDSVLGDVLLEDRISPGVLRWDPDPTGLRLPCSVLATHPSKAALLVHMEPARPSVAMLDSLDTSVREITSEHDPADTPLRKRIANDNLRRLQELPRAAVEVRVVIAAAGPLQAGLLESVGISLTSGASFLITHPRDEADLFRTAQLFESLTSRAWVPSGNSELDEILRLCDTAEAAGVFRLPVPMRGGSPGLTSVPLSTLPRSAPSEKPKQKAVRLGRSTGGGSIEISLAELNQHLLVAGLPGFGKTATTQLILERLWVDHGIPFLVIDPAKSDYNRLADRIESEALMVQLGPNQPAFNPFAVPAGTSSRAHASRVLAAFDSTFNLSSTWPLGYVTLARGIFAAYEESDVGHAPTLRQVYAAVGDSLRRSSFQGPDGANARAALLARLEFLARGPLGAALLGGTHDAIAWKEILARPTIVELRTFGGPGERALVFALLLAGLISQREGEPHQGGLRHVTVLEEAHRVLRNAASESEGVRLFVEAIAELRGSGEGFIIVDQAPTQLHPGVLKLCGSIITHRLIEEHERAVIGASVLLDRRQQEDLARLGIGQAVVYTARSVASSVALVDEDFHEPAESSGRAERRTNLSGNGDMELPFCIGCRTTCLHDWNSRRLNAQFPPRADTAAGLAEHFGQHTRDLGLVRCAAARAGATAWKGGLPQFLVWLRGLDDEVSRRVRSEAQDAHGKSD